MAVLYGIYSALQQNSQRSYIGKSKENDMLKAKCYIDENFHAQEFGIALLAEKIGISEVYLRKLFKAQFGISPSGYLISIRLKHAKALMKYPFLTLEECALQSDFASLQYFCRLFKKESAISARTTSVCSASLTSFSLGKKPSPWSFSVLRSK